MCRQCLQEIARLEGARKDLMLSIIEAKRQQLAAICAESHMSLPESHTSEGSEVTNPACLTMDARYTLRVYKTIG